MFPGEDLPGDADTMFMFGGGRRVEEELSVVVRMGKEREEGVGCDGCRFPVQ